MITVSSLAEIPSLSTPIALTIGSFDGVHLGHQHLFHELKTLGTPTVLTFSNHPSEILYPQPLNELCSLAERLNLFEACGIELTIVLPFTLTLAQTSYEEFLKKLYSHLPFHHLVLGEGAVLGARGEGSERQIQLLSKEIGFTPIYLKKMVLDGEVVSSRRIRSLIGNNQIEQAQKLLGRKFL